MDRTCAQQPDTASDLPSHRGSFHTEDSTAHGAPRGCCATRRVREPKADLLALVQRLHILQPAVDIPRDISLRLAFGGWTALVKADHAIVWSAALRIMQPLTALLKSGILSQRPLPNLSRVTVSSCNEYTWRSLELGVMSIPAFETQLSDCRRVIPVLLTALRPGDPERSAVNAEWIQQATHGPFVLPAARLVDLAPRPLDYPGSSITDGDGRYRITFTADQRGRGCCFPPIVNGSLNVIIYGQPQRERWNSRQALVKGVLKMLEETVQGFDEDLKDGTVIVLKGLLEPEREESGDGSHVRDAFSSGQKAGPRSLEGRALSSQLNEAAGPRWQGRIQVR